MKGILLFLGVFNLTLAIQAQQWGQWYKHYFPDGRFAFYSRALVEDLGNGRYRHTIVVALASDAKNLNIHIYNLHVNSSPNFECYLGTGPGYHESCTFSAEDDVLPSNSSDWNWKFEDAYPGKGPDSTWNASQAKRLFAQRAESQINADI